MVLERVAIVSSHPRVNLSRLVGDTHRALPLAVAVVVTCYIAPLILCLLIAGRSYGICGAFGLTQAPLLLLVLVSRPIPQCHSATQTRHLVFL